MSSDSLVDAQTRNKHGQERELSRKSLHDFVVQYTYSFELARRPVIVSTILTSTFAWTVLGLGIVPFLTLYLS